MARAKKKPSKRDSLPEVGSVFLMPLEDGRFGVCRVRNRRNDSGTEVVLVDASDWIGSEAPDLVRDRKAIKRTLHLSHHNWSNKPERLWVSEPPPDTFRLLGTLPVTADDAAVECMTWGGWQGASFQVLMQWRWEHDREAVLAEDAIKAAESAKATAVAIERQKKKLAKTTLPQLRNKRWFSGWKGYASDKVLRDTRRIIRELVDTLIEAGEKPGKRKVKSAVRKAVEALNELDGTDGFCIDTICREDLCECLDTIAAVCGVPESDIAGPWRDW